MSKSVKRETGDEGEQIACDYLERIGYKVLGRQINLGIGEIDILALDGKIVVLVEVKTVRGSGFGLAQELVRFKKQKKLLLLGRALEQKYPNRTIRIDVIGVNLSGDEPKIEHLINCLGSV